MTEPDDATLAQVLRILLRTKNYWYVDAYDSKVHIEGYAEVTDAEQELVLAVWNR